MWLLTHVSAIFGVILGLAFARSVLSERRAPASALAWLLSILLLPSIGVPLYLTLGGRKLKRRLASKPPPLDPQRLAEEAKPDPLTRMLSSYGLAGSASGNCARLITSGEATFEEVLALIDGAQHSVDVMTFILGRDDVGTAVLGRLEKKAAAGVQVRLLMDGLFAARSSSARFNALSAAGGKWASFLPIVKRQSRQLVPEARYPCRSRGRAGQDHVSGMGSERTARS